MKSMSRGLGLILVMALLPAFSLASSAVDAVSDGPQQWAAAPYWSPPSVRAGGRNALYVTPSIAKPLPFVALAPCRVADTRTTSTFTGAYGSPWISPLPANQRAFVIAGQCGIPADAKAVSFNFTVWAPTARGDLRVYPGPVGTAPNDSTLNWEANILALANGASIQLGTSGDIAVQVDGTAPVDLIIDINGYYSPLYVVNTLAAPSGYTLMGDIGLVAGSNITITATGPTGAGTLTISGAVGTTGPSGVAGAIGPTGPVGNQGSPGSSGANGAIGATGPTGASGAPGGPAGPTGPSGPAGFSLYGPTGVAYGPTGGAGSSEHIVIGLALSGTPVALTGSAIFSSSTSYSCTGTDTNASTIGAVAITQTNGASFTFTGLTGHTFQYVCVGN